MPFRLGHLLLITGSLCSGLVWWRSLREQSRRHQNQLFHESGTVASKPKARRCYPVASSQGAEYYDLSGSLVSQKTFQIQLWNDNLTGTCYANTMQWAIYDPLTEEVLRPDPELNSSRSHHPPTWNVVLEEREYCVRLTRWWAAVQMARVERQGTAVQIGGGQIVTSERKQTKRQHLLIGEADPGREPGGYFNCTVEVRVF
jgi:hypothetical protein